MSLAMTDISRPSCALAEVARTIRRTGDSATPTIPRPAQSRQKRRDMPAISQYLQRPHVIAWHEQTLGNGRGEQEPTPSARNLRELSAAASGKFGGSGGP